MVSLARRSGWIRQKRGEKWRTGIFFAAVVGKDGMNGILLPSPLSPPSPLRPNFILSGCFLCKFLKDPSCRAGLGMLLFPAGGFQGDGDGHRRGAAGSPGERVERARSGEEGWRKALGEEKGRERRKREGGEEGRRGSALLVASGPVHRKATAEPLGASHPPPPPPPAKKTTTSSFPGSIPVAGSGTRSHPLPVGAPSLPRAHKANHWCLMKKHLLN